MRAIVSNRRDLGRQLWTTLRLDRPIVHAARVGRSVDHVVERQSGVIARRQALEAGMSSSAIAARIRDRKWFQMHTGVYLTPTYRRTTESDLWAGLLSTPGSVLSGAGAAWRWGLTEDSPAFVELIVPTSRRPRPKRGVTILRRDLDRRDVTRCQGMAVVSR